MGETDGHHGARCLPIEYQRFINSEYSSFGEELQSSAIIDIRESLGSGEHYVMYITRQNTQ